MIRRFALLALCCAVAQPVSARQVAAPPAPAPIAAAAAPMPQPAMIRVILTTSEGSITLALDRDHAPITTANFLHYVDTKRLDGVSFYRAMNLAVGVGLVQGGVRDAAKLYAPITLEPTTLTGLHHGDGTISMARAAPDSARADFFIIVGDMPSLDAQPGQTGDSQGFAAFGHVVEGMDIVRRILAAPTSATQGDGPMKGQMLAPPIRILSARRVR